MTFEHKGTSIVLNEVTGRFEATIKGQKVKAASLEAMRKRIDFAEKTDFKPFTALDTEGGRRSNSLKVVEIKIVDIRKPANPRYNRSPLTFVSDDGTEHGWVMENTPKNRKLVKQWCDAQMHEEKMKAHYELLTERARMAIVKIKAEDYKAK